MRGSSTRSSPPLHAGLGYFSPPHPIERARFGRLEMVSANREMVVYCFNTLVSHYSSEQPPPAAFNEAEHPLFVTWKKTVNGSDPRLRGCIGTLEARYLINGFRDYALTRCSISSTEGRVSIHFLSITSNIHKLIVEAKELSHLECTVSILTKYESALHYLDWEVGKHSLIIEFTDPDYNTRRSVTYFPEVAAHEGWTKVETIDSLMRKAGYNGPISKSLRKKLHITHYESTLCTMHYNDYASYVKTTQGAAPVSFGVKPSH